nr:MAG TPA: hypothetical protein [Caudoviricetes sp.]
MNDELRNYCWAGDCHLGCYRWRVWHWSCSGDQ